MRRRGLVWALALVALAACGGGGKAVKKGDPVPLDFALHSLVSDSPSNLAPVALAPERVLLRGGIVMTAAGRVIQGGDVLLEEGQIKAVSETPLSVGAGVAVIDVRGKFVTPGIIDTHSHLGVYPVPSVAAHADGNEATNPVTADVDALHSVWPQDPGFFRALEGGITAMQILPGSANLVGGRAMPLKMHPGVSARAMRFFGAPPGLKMACGENPKRVYGGKNNKPSTRMGNMAVWRQTFLKAQEYQQKLEEHEKAWLRWDKGERAPKDEPKPPGRDLGMETLVAVMQGDVLVHVHCYRADEMIQVLELSEEFGFKVRSFHHAVEAYKIRDVLAAWGVSVSTWADWWGFKIEAHDAILENAALISEAGARAIIHSDSPVGIQRLNQEAAKVYYAGRAQGLALDEDEALRWITLNPAWAMGVDHLTGSLEEGKQADVVVWSGHPLSVYARPELVFVDGVREFERGKTAPWSDFELEQLPKMTGGAR
jgi:imidazolonepropionase-like amidohydrolase